MRKVRMECSVRWQRAGGVRTHEPLCAAAFTPARPFSLFRARRDSPKDGSPLSLGLCRFSVESALWFHFKSIWSINKRIVVFSLVQQHSQDVSFSSDFSVVAELRACVLTRVVLRASCYFKCRFLNRAVKAARERFAAVISVWPVCGPEPRGPGCHGPSLQSLTCTRECMSWGTVSCAAFAGTALSAPPEPWAVLGFVREAPADGRLCCWVTAPRGSSGLLGLAGRAWVRPWVRPSVSRVVAPPAPPPAPQSALPGVLRPPEVPVSLEQRAAGPGGRDRVPRSAPSSLSPGCSGREHNLCSWGVLLTWPGAQDWGLPRSS